MFRCLFGHKWKVVDSCVTNYYEHEHPTADMPYKVETKILYQCEICGRHDSRVVNGEYQRFI